MLIKEPECDHRQGNFWSEWKNIDKPSGDGDLELLALEKDLPCSNPSYIDYQTVDGVKANSTGQVVHIDSCYGLICLNREQNNQTCLDYRFRMCCKGSDVSWTTPATTTTTRPPPRSNSFLFLK